ncbi:MAG: hypothetical protein IJ015_06455 [Ruminococcus sp.]|nr:hypothetical protein [Ruminococcus sp.]
MDFNKLFEIFKGKCRTAVKFTNTKTGKKLFIISCVVFFVLFLAPLFHGSVGAALLGCVAAPLTVMIWRRFDSEHAVVPAVFFCIPMVIDMIVYHNLSTASCLLVGCVCTIAVAIHPIFDFIKKIEDSIYSYLACGAVCVAIVVLSSLVTLLVSIAWWLFCLILFVALLVVFFSVVLSTAAYTATDAKRQQRKKERKQYDAEAKDYDFDSFAEDIGLKDEIEYRQRSLSSRPKRNRKDDPLFYDVD